MLKMFAIENNFLQTVRQSQKTFIDKYSFGNIGTKNKRIVTDIYEKKNSKNLNGKHIY